MKLLTKERLSAFCDAIIAIIMTILVPELKTLPSGEVWDEYCRACAKPADGEWYKKIEEYEEQVLEARI